MAYKVVSAKPTITTLRTIVAGKLGDKKTAHQAVNATIEAFQSLLTARIRHVLHAGHGRAHWQESPDRPAVAAACP